MVVEVKLIVILFTLIGLGILVKVQLEIPVILTKFEQVADTESKVEVLSGSPVQNDGKSIKSFPLCGIVCLGLKLKVNREGSSTSLELAEIEQD